MWADLAPIGRDTRSGGYRRFAWSGPDAQLREWFVGEAGRRGLGLTEDRAGNQWAWWGDPDAGGPGANPGIVVGSHLDSVPDGGAFDGPLGVVSAFAALDLLRANGFEPERPIGVANFVDEEGARFGVACAGSRLITGVLDPDRARGLTDTDGVTMAAALRAAGRDPARLGRDDDALRRVAAYVELHIEQGRLLATLAQDAPVALAREIWPHGRWRLDFPGEANHAGTTRLGDRRDAMIGFAATVLAARRAAEAHDALATVGKVRVVPGGVNAIPSAVTGWLDARGADAEAVERLVQDVHEVAGQAGATLTAESWTPATVFDPGLALRLGTRLGGVPVIGTGAGHDAGILTTAGVSCAMLFVRNRTGVSHSPAEWADEEDCLVGVSALAHAVEELAGAAL